LDDVTINSMPVIHKGTPVSATASAYAASWKGHGGQLFLAIENVTDILGNSIPLVSELAWKGASYDLDWDEVLPSVILGYGMGFACVLLEHLLTRGENVNLPYGYKVTAYVRNAVYYSPEELKEAYGRIDALRSKGIPAIYIYSRSKEARKKKVYVDGAPYFRLPDFSVLKTTLDAGRHVIRCGHSELILNAQYGEEHYILVAREKNLILIPKEQGKQDIISLRSYSCGLAGSPCPPKAP
jgi:hypothetical protein